MVNRSFIIANKLGLHVRPASILADALAKYESDATLIFGGQAYNAKSPTRMLAACVKSGQTIELQIEGRDEQDAMADASILIELGFGE